MSSSADPTHPRFRERRAEVEDQSLRSRNRKLAFAGVVVLLGLIGAAVTQSALLDVDEIAVIGTERLAPDEIRAVAGIELDEPILGLDTNAAKLRLLELTEVQDVEVTASWRGTVTIDVIERLPVARISSPEGAMIVAADGLVLDVISEATEETETLIEITGAMFSRARTERVPDVVNDALVIADVLPRDLAEITESVQITVDALVLRMVGGGEVSLGDARDLPEKFDAVRAFVEQVNLGCLSSLNVAAPSSPVIVRNPNCS